MVKAYKYRIYPTKEQILLIHNHFGCCRYIHNYALQKKITTYQQDNIALSRFDLQKEIPVLKKTSADWLKVVNSQSLQASLENLDKSFTQFFKGVTGFPKFKSKHDKCKSFQSPQNNSINYTTKTLHIPKFKKGIKIKLSREIPGIIKTVSILKSRTNKYYASINFQVEESCPELKPIDENQAIGIDLGIKTFATLSNGIEIENPKFLRKSLRKLKRLQKRHSKKQKGSINREKSRIKLAKLHEKVTNKRTDFLHKVTCQLTNDYSTICLETLKVKNMVKNHKLAQALSDVSIGTFNTQIEYKAKEKGVNIIRIGQFEPSSKMCSCGTINKELKLKDRIWVCTECGSINDRDLLAAQNIKRFAFSKINTEGHSEI